MGNNGSGFGEWYLKELPADSFHRTKLYERGIVWQGQN